MLELQNLRTWLRREENHFVVTVGEDNDVRVHNIKEGPRRHPFKKQNRTKPHEIETQRWYFTRCFRCVNLLLPWFPCVSHVVREFSISFLSFRSLPRSRSLTLRVALRGLVGPHIPHRTDTDKIRKVSQWFSRVPFALQSSFHLFHPMQKPHWSFKHTGTGIRKEQGSEEGWGTKGKAEGQGHRTWDANLQPQRNFMLTERGIIQIILLIPIDRLMCVAVRYINQISMRIISCKLDQKHVERDVQRMLGCWMSQPAWPRISLCPMASWKRCSQVRRKLELDRDILNSLEHIGHL